MRPLYHVIAAGAGAVPIYYATGSAELAAFFAVSEVGMDVDHLIDHALWSKRPLDYGRFFEKGVTRTWSRIVFILHGYEIIFLWGVFAWWLNSPPAWAVVMGFSVHLLLDEIGNRLPWEPIRIKWPFYFFSYRLINGFKPDKISSLKSDELR